MALPHKEWRAYLDTILDSYIRTNVTVDAVGYMVDRMEEVCTFSIAHELAFLPLANRFALVRYSPSI
jgi:hypothetical protein